ncbi:comm3 isoform 2-T3 [Cochliomyia hominivorax]
MLNQTYAEPMIHGDDQLLLYKVHNFDNPFDNTTTVVMMILAWFVLILGFSICCCSQCFKGGFWSSKWRSCGLDGTASDRGNGDDWYDTNSITTVAAEVDRTNNNENVEICRNFPPNYEAESLPSYTIVSGLPTYDDAIEEFRKAGILLTPPMPVIKIFEAKENKDSIYNVDNNINDSDNVSVASVNTCICGGGTGATTNGAINVGTVLNNINSSSQQYLAATPTTTPSAINTQFIELSPEQLSALSQKRLSLQIAFPPAIRRNSRPRVDMRNNLLRSRAVGNTAGYDTNFPQIHRSSSSFSLANERQNMQMMQHHLQHRGSLF